MHMFYRLCSYHFSLLVRILYADMPMPFATPRINIYCFPWANPHVHVIVSQGAIPMFKYSIYRTKFLKNNDVVAFIEVEVGG